MAEDQYQTKVLAVSPSKIGRFVDHSDYRDSSVLPLTDWHVELDETSQDAQHVRQASEQLRQSDVPVAFPTETVYGLGADATRSSAVRGIYAAKRRPADNPLIVHVASIRQLRSLLLGTTNNESHGHDGDDPIPDIYKPLIQRFWPGPLTIILPTPEHSSLASEVTAGLSTFGARMPRNLLALTLIKLADRPIAAPSANASTRPSPTAAEHVLDDLTGRIELILDSGPCDVGVESTVVDGLCSPPCVLRPGGISLDELREVPGWEGTVKAYADETSSKTGDVKPRAPGMKYRHYSPRARVLLAESRRDRPSLEQLKSFIGRSEDVIIGVVRTKRWQRLYEDGAGVNSIREALDPTPVLSSREKRREQSQPQSHQMNGHGVPAGSSTHDSALSERSPIAGMLADLSHSHRTLEQGILTTLQDGVKVWDVMLGPDTKDVARGLFSALRDLDKRHVDAIVVEGIDDGEGDLAGAVMNRLRKAADPASFTTMT